MIRVFTLITSKNELITAHFVTSSHNTNYINQTFYKFEYSGVLITIINVKYVRNYHQSSIAHINYSRI